MFLATASVKRPVAMSALIIGLTLLGIYSYFKMNLELMPKTDLPYITIVTVYPGASPEQIETEIAKKIEDQMMTLDGLKHITSSCMENVCQTLIELNVGMDVDIAATDVREKLDLIKEDMPEDAEDSKVLKYDVNATPVANMALTGSLPLDELYDYADNKLRDKMTVIPGVADISLVGGAKREVQILLDRDRLAARGLSTLEVVQIVGEAVKTIPMGRIKDSGNEIAVEFNAEFAEVERLNDLELINHGGQTVHIRDVGQVKMGTEELRQISFVGSKPCISLKVIKRSDANAVNVVNALKSSMNKFNESLPAGMKLEWFSDDGRYIQANADSAWMNVLQGIGLTALILFLFLYNFRVLAIVAITMPLNIIISFFFMMMFDFTFNLSTLISICLSVGILVTNALVVLESIMKKFETCHDAKLAAIEGTSACTSEVLASCGTNIVVLFPIARLPGAPGLFLKPLALTMLIVTAVSLFVAFTVIPMLSSLLLKEETNEKSWLKRIQNSFNSVLARITEKYMTVLQLFQQKKWLSVAFILVIALMIGHSLTLAKKLGSAFAPDADMAKATIKLEFPTGYSLEHTRKKTLEAVELLKGLPELQSVLINIGKVEGMIGKSSEGVYLAEINLRLSDRDRRAFGVKHFLTLAQKRFKNFTDAIVTLSVPAPVGGSAAPVKIEISGDDFVVLDQTVMDLKEKADELEGFSSTDTSARPGKPKILVTPKRNVLSENQIPVVALGTSLRGNLEGLTAATFKRGDRSYDIVVKFLEQKGIDQIEKFSFTGKNGKTVALNAYADLENTRAPVQILRKDKKRIATFESFLDNLSLGNAINTVIEILENGLLKKGYDYYASGDAEMMAEAQAGLLEAAVIAMVLVVLTLAAIMESYIQPALILCTIPPALIGMIWSLYLMGYSISVFVIMGGVMLIGIVVNNAILIVEKCNHLVKIEKMTKQDAIIRAAGDQFRPVIMITLAAVLGMLPMAFGSGIGAELRNDIGIASAGGILSSGILSLFLIPIVYSLFLPQKS
jgi:HAE1 family hydrophobic/amphiphilic exporter-1